MTTGDIPLPPPIITVDDEIIVRHPSLDDAEPLFDLIERNRAHLAPWMPWENKLNTVEDERAYLAKTCTEDGLANQLGGVIEHREEIAGKLGLSGLNSLDRAGEIGYFLAADMQGKGIVTKCCRKLISLAFNEFDMHRVMIRAARHNGRSRAVPERLGFTFEGYQREASYTQGEFHDLAVYSMLAHEWEGGG